MARRPVAAFTTGKGEAECIVVICDDGTGWIYDINHYEWSEMASIPGSKAEKKADAAEE